MAICRFVSIFCFTAYDIKCMIFEHASVIDCHQDGLLPDPESWIFVWIFLSCLSSSLFLIIFGCGYKLGFLKFRPDKICSAWRKSSFVSLSLLTIPTNIYYGFRIASGVNEEINGATSFFLFLWPIIVWVVVWVLNYTPTARKCDNQNCPHTIECCSPQKMVEHCFIWRLFYWTSLGMYSCETFFKFLSVLLDVTHDIAPLIEREFSDESLKGFIAILSGLRLAFHSRVFMFFWDKLFHGDKDLFCEPSINLEGEHETTSKDEEKNNETTSKDEEKNSETTSKDEEKNNETTSKDEEKNNETTSKDEEKNNETTSKDEEKNNETTSKDEEKNNETTSKDEEKNNETISKDEEKNNETTSKDEEKNNETTSKDEEKNNETTSKDEEKNNETTSKDEENNNETTSKDEEKNNETTSKDEENNNETTSKDEEKNNETTSKDEKAQDEILSNDKSIQDVATSTDEEKLSEGKPLVDKTIPQENVKPKRSPPSVGSEKDKSAKPYESTSTKTATPDTVPSTNNVKPSVAVKPTQIELELNPTT